MLIDVLSVYHYAIQHYGTGREFPLWNTIFSSRLFEAIVHRVAIPLSADTDEERDVPAETNNTFWSISQPQIPIHYNFPQLRRFPTIQPYVIDPNSFTV